MLRRRHFLATLTAALPAAASDLEVIAHRGEHLVCPENTIPAIQKAINLGCHWVEIDVRTTRDGHFVLMHNATVDATTSGQGAVAEMTLAEIRALDAAVSKPQFRGTRVPTLDEALAVMRGKCGVYFDAKQIAAEAIAAALQLHGMLQRCVVYGSLPLLKELTQLGHSQLAMPEAVSVELAARSLKELAPRTMAFDRRDFRPQVIAVARAAGKGVFVDRLGAEDTPDHWREAVRLGATGIQTGHPAQLLALRLVKLA